MVLVLTQCSMLHLTSFKAMKQVMQLNTAPDSAPHLMNEMLVRKNVEPIFFLVSSCRHFSKVEEKYQATSTGAHSQ